VRAPEAALARAVIVAWLTVMWVLLWGDLSPANVLSGVLAALALVVVFPPSPTNDDPFVVRPLPALSFLAWFLWALVVTNVRVAREVVLPASRSKIRTAVVAVPLRTRSGRLATVVANAITLTPGTLTVDARGRPAVLFVHVLSFDDAEATRAEIADLERRVVRAFGTAEEVDRICGPARKPRREWTAASTAAPEEVDG
jgi:multicomponent Na+:H+ antiporter subunit E